MKKRILWVLALAIPVLGWILYTPDLDPAELEARYGDSGSRFINLPSGARAHYRTSGPSEAPSLLLIHGSTSSLHTWEPWVPSLEQQLRLVRVDLPGHGLTGAIPSDDYSIESRVAFVDELREALGIANWSIAGNSMGGHVAWRYALRYPSRIDKLVLIDASGVRVPVEGDTWKAVLGFRLAAVPGVNRLLEWFTPRRMVQQGVRLSWSDQSRVDDTMIDRYYELLRYPGNRRATRLRLSQLEEWQSHRLTEIGASTLILWGEDDRVITVAAGQAMHRAIPDSTLKIYPRVGHLPMEEVAEASAQDTLRFLLTEASLQESVEPEPASGRP